MPEGMLEDKKRIGYIRSRVSCVAAGDLAGPVIEWLYWGALGDGLGYAIAELSWSAIQSHLGPEGLQTPRYKKRHLVVPVDTQMTHSTHDRLSRADLGNPDSVVQEMRKAYRD